MTQNRPAVSRKVLENQLVILKEAYLMLAERMRKENISTATLIKIIRTLRYLSDGIERLEKTLAQPGGIPQDDMDKLLDGMQLELPLSVLKENP